MGATLKRAASCALYLKALTPFCSKLRVARFPLISPYFRGFSKALESSVLRCSTSKAYKQRPKCSWFLARAPPVPSSLLPSEFGYQTPESFFVRTNRIPYHRNQDGTNSMTTIYKSTTYVLAAITAQNLFHRSPSQATAVTVAGVSESTMPVSSSEQKEK